MSTRAATTLSSASSAIDEPLEEVARGSRGRWLGLGALVVGGAIAAVLLLPGDKPKPAPAAAATVQTAPAALAPPQAPAVPPLKKTVTLRFEAEPAGAHVFGRNDGRDLGVVPVEVQLTKETTKKGGPLAYVYRLSGYRDLALSAEPDADRTYHVSLEKLPVVAPEPGKHKPPPSASHHVTGKKPHNPVDEDG